MIDRPTTCAFCGRIPTIGMHSWAHLCNPGNENGERFMKADGPFSNYDESLADWESFNNKTEVTMKERVGNER